MMQKEQRLLQPSWILRMGRVWWDSSPWMGAERNSGWAKMSPVRIWAGRGEALGLEILPRWGVEGGASPAPTKEWNGASSEVGGKSRFLASLGMTVWWLVTVWWLMARAGTAGAIGVIRTGVWGW